MIYAEGVGEQKCPIPRTSLCQLYMRIGAIDRLLQVPYVNRVAGYSVPDYN